MTPLRGRFAEQSLSQQRSSHVVPCGRAVRATADEFELMIHGHWRRRREREERRVHNRIRTAHREVEGRLWRQADVDIQGVDGQAEFRTIGQADAGSLQLKWMPAEVGIVHSFASCALSHCKLHPCTVCNNACASARGCHKNRFAFDIRVGECCNVG